MEPSRITHESLPGHQAAGSIAGPDDVAVLGTPTSNPIPSLHPEGAPELARPHGRITVTGVMKLLEWQKFRCALTGRELTPETASLDHIVPVRCGGEHLLENAQALHKDVNRAKTTMTSDEFIQMCDEVVKYATGRIV